MNKAAIAVGVLAIIGAPALWFLGRPTYRHYRELRAVEQARRFAVRQEFRKAALSARQALLLNPRNVDACELMAGMAEVSGAPQTLEWRRRVAEIAPTVENRLKLLSAAVLYEAPPCPVAERTLREISASGQSASAVHALSARLALKLNCPDQAEAELLEASRLDPTNQWHQFNLAVLRLGSTNEIVAAKATQSLELLAQKGEFAPGALRSLISASIVRREFATAERYSARLLADRRSSFDDRLRHLGIVREEDAAGFAPFLADLRSKVVTNAAEVQGLAVWMIQNQLVQEALVWLTNCPQALQQQQPVRTAVANAYAAQQDWAGLERYLQAQKWGEWEFLRLGLLARAAFEEKRKDEGEAQWRLALYQAGGDLGALSTLARLAAPPVPEKGREDLFWRVAEKFPGERWAWQELDRLYISAGNTRGLHRLYSAMWLLNGGDVFLKNNLAATSLLLNLNATRAHEWAKQNYEGHSAEPILASTYAYSLHLQGRTRAGLEVLAKLSPEALEKPTIALYYGLLLSADGQKETGAKYLEVASGARLLPEERALLANARQAQDRARGK